MTNHTHAILIHQKPRLGTGLRGGVAQIGASKTQKPIFYAGCGVVNVCVEGCNLCKSCNGYHSGIQLLQSVAYLVYIVIN